jgi:hypothetical protein
MMIYVMLREQRIQMIYPIWNHAGARESASSPGRRERPSQHLTRTVLYVSSPVSNPSPPPAFILTTHHVTGLRNLGRSFNNKDWTASHISQPSLPSEPFIALHPGTKMPTGPSSRDFILEGCGLYQLGEAIFEIETWNPPID